MRAFLAAIFFFASLQDAVAQNVDDPMTVATVGDLRFNCQALNRIMAGRVVDQTDGWRASTCGAFVVGAVTGAQFQAFATHTQPAFCPPADLSTGQEIQLFLNWSNAHPEHWTRSAAIGVGMTMMEAFPC